MSEIGLIIVIYNRRPKVVDGGLVDVYFVF